MKTLLLAAALALVASSASAQSFGVWNSRGQGYIGQYNPYSGQGVAFNLQRPGGTLFLSGSPGYYGPCFRPYYYAPTWRPPVIQDRSRMGLGW